jgi:DtxR family manganese transport transcriptional regulator
MTQRHEQSGAGETSLMSVTAGFQQTRAAHAGEQAADYVELIHELIERHGEARLVDIASRMGVSHVTANKTVARLQRDGLVQKRPYRAVFLTDEGRKLAEAGREKHAVVVRFLCALGVEKEQACIDAEGLEHHISDMTLAAMVRFLARSERGGSSVHAQ